MSENMVIIIPAGLTTKQCYDYVGGQPIFEELLAKHGDILKPLRRTPRGDLTYRRVTVDAALQVAEASGSLIHPLLKDPTKVIKKKGDRRFSTNA